MTAVDELTLQVRAFLADARQFGPVPRYGTHEWARLPHDDARRNAAVYLAAECWRDHCSPGRIADDLRHELQVMEAVIARRMKQSSWDISAAADWHYWANRPTFAELQARRGVDQGDEPSSR